MTFGLIQELKLSMLICITAAERDEVSGRRSCRGAAVFLALLCLLLLVGLTTMASLCKFRLFLDNCLVFRVLSDCLVISTPRITLHEECVTDAMDSTASERDQLLARNMELEGWTEQLQQRISNLSNHNRELQTSIQGNSTSLFFFFKRSGEVPKTKKEQQAVHFSIFVRSIFEVYTVKFSTMMIYSKFSLLQDSQFSQVRLLDLN